MRRLLAVVAVLLSLSCLSARAEDTWMSVMLDGRKIGHLETERVVADGRITTTQHFSLMLTRNARSIPLLNTTTSIEDQTGTPLGFSANTSMSAQESQVQGSRRANGQFELFTDTGGQRRYSMLILPPEAMLVEAQRQTMRRQGWAPGTHYQMLNFDASSQQTVNIDITVLGTERVELPGGVENLHHLRQSLNLARGAQVMDLWLDDEAHVRKGSMPLLGFHMEMLACDKRCALAPDQDVDMLRIAMADAPRPLTYNLRAEPLRYWIRMRNLTAGEPFIQTDEQQVARLSDDLWQVDVGSPRAGTEPPPQPEDTAANDWMQSDAPAIRDTAARAVGDATSDLQRMRRLRLFVSSYIEKKGLDIGYASALETLGTRQGDCTEHAVLLAALARAVGIPARVVTGMVYAERSGGASRVFVPHAWMQAWIDGRWTSYDAALGRFDSTHIALAVGNGDPWKFFAGMGVFGNIVIERATPQSEYFQMPMINLVPPGTNGGKG
jgi:Transglutaminase-like superfamily